MNLIVTVGTNPLPSFVVSEYFCKMNHLIIDRVYLVHSDEENMSSHSSTRKQAEAVRDLLETRLGKRICYLVPLKKISGREIRYSLDEFFSKHDIQGPVHLNYTGGTKAMAVQISSFIKGKFKSSASSSYLDAREYRINYDDVPIASPEEMRSKVFLSISDLLKLHGYKKLDQPEIVSFPGVISTIKELIEKGHIEKLINLGNKFVPTLYQEEGKSRPIEKPGRFRKRLEELGQDKVRQMFSSLSQEDIDVLNSFPQERCLLENGQLWVPSGEITNDQYKSRTNHTVEFLKGKWLEELVAEKIAEYAENNHLQYGFNLKAKRENLPDFELDAFLIKGYQLLAISVTTSSARHLCKSKGFEVIHRSRQIGGDESRSILVTLMDQTVARELQAELQVESGSSSDSFVVLHRSNYKDIGDYIDRLFR